MLQGCSGGEPSLALAIVTPPPPPAAVVDPPDAPELVPIVVLVAPPALPMLLTLVAADWVPLTVAPVALAVETDVAVVSDPLAAAVPVPTPFEDEDDDAVAVVVVSVVVPSGGSSPLLHPAPAMASTKS